MTRAGNGSARLGASAENPWANFELAQLLRTITVRQRPGRGHRGESSLLEYRPAGVAEAGLLPPQAGGDRPRVGDFAGAETIEVGRARPLLFRRADIGRRQTAGGNSGKPCLHDSIPLEVRRRHDSAGVVQASSEKIVGRM